MKKVMLILCTMALGGVICVAFAADEKPCKKPNSSTGECADPTAGQGRQMVDDCTEHVYPNCLGLSQYVINSDWPKGTEPSDKGVTTEKRENCYRETFCAEPYHPIDIGKPCRTSETTGGWIKKPKTIVDPDTSKKCPDE